VQNPATQTPLLPQFELIVQGFGTQKPPVQFSFVPQLAADMQAWRVQDLYEWRVQVPDSHWLPAVQAHLPPSAQVPAPHCELAVHVLAPHVPLVPLQLSEAPHWAAS